jgi:8-oxo-dGTP pyrophosphatase MutT (NUDIX family)
LLLKRNPKISFGGLYAFPGGMVEKQDYLEPWKEYYGGGAPIRYQDFTKRMCVVRELFEETNILFAHNTGTAREEENPTLLSYNEKHKANFLSFSKACGIKPDLDNLFAF